MSRTFTLEEANALIPRVTAALACSTQLLGRARAGARRLMEVGVRPSNPGGLPHPDDVTDPALARDVIEVQLMVEVAQQEARRLEALGVTVTDLERGRVDFRSVLDGQREVALCWELGETRIQTFHELAGGCVDRKPIGAHRFFGSRQLVPPQSN
ncbi:MAG: DUF2203 domain-containing protein [Sandaracinaceae bacterium]